jgi:hypothetical protein
MIINIEIDIVIACGMRMPYKPKGMLYYRIGLNYTLNSLFVAEKSCGCTVTRVYEAMNNEQYLYLSIIDLLSQEEIVNGL